mmetsp:Transcript_7188/g.29168  ORF Transcript_7188/g.29168 Transcript_7188/m.29168 type:complete len:472 (+) Transcript_7188:256-1671(+)
MIESLPHLLPRFQPPNRPRDVRPGPRTPELKHRRVDVVRISPPGLLLVLGPRSRDLRRRSFPGGRLVVPGGWSSVITRQRDVLDVHVTASHAAPVRRRVVRVNSRERVHLGAENVPRLRPVAPDVHPRRRGPRGSFHRRRHRPGAHVERVSVPIPPGKDIHRVVRGDVGSPEPAGGTRMLSTRTIGTRQIRLSPPGAQSRRRRVHPRAAHLLRERRRARRERRGRGRRPVPRGDVRGRGKRVPESLLPRALDSRRRLTSGALFRGGITVRPRDALRNLDRHEGRCRGVRGFPRGGRGGGPGSESLEEDPRVRRRPNRRHSHPLVKAALVGTLVFPADARRWGTEHHRRLGRRLPRRRHALRLDRARSHRRLAQLSGNGANRLGVDHRDAGASRGGPRGERPPRRAGRPDHAQDPGGRRRERGGGGGSPRRSYRRATPVLHARLTPGAPLWRVSVWIWIPSLPRLGRATRAR